MKSYIFQLVALLFCVSVYAQKDTDVLLQINNESITVKEFKQVYLKNLDLLQEDSKKTPDSYMDLFIPYKLKVQEAYNLGLDKNESYIKELAGYKKQLAKNFLTDVSLTDKLVKEAYDRTVNERSARHILVKLSPGAAASDTLVAYNKIIEAREKILSGEDFEKIAKEYSEDPSAQSNGGDLGWFKAFKMVYPFENAAYSTAVNEVSMPFKTSFGYHIVQTTGQRKGEGAVQVAHIMILEKQKDSTINPKERIDKIYQLLQEGEEFASLAKTYSDDTQTASKDGVIRKFERGQISSKEFENQAFALTVEGEYTKPFKTSFGWHISKLMKRYPLESFEDVKVALEEKIKKDRRSQVISQALIKKLKKKYHQEDITEVVNLVKEKTTGEFKGKKWVFNANPTNSNKPVFTIRDSVYTMEALGRFVERTYNPNRHKNKDAFFEETAGRYIDLKLQEYHENHLDEIEPDFAAILSEYREGLLIFDLMEQQIWNKAKTDSIGLQQFYQTNRTTYKTGPRAIAQVYTSGDKKALIDFSNKLKSNPEEAKENLPSNLLKTAKELLINDKESYSPNYTPTQGLSEVVAFNKGYVLYDVSEMLPESIRSLEEAKGQVISDYQQYLEANWIEDLKSKASIKIDKKVLKKLTKQLK